MIENKTPVQYDLISENPESTVVAEFEGGYYSSAQYQSEAVMEDDFIKRLQRQAYEYVKITTEAELIANLRRELERLNNIKFTDGEWDEFFHKHLGNTNEGIVEKTRTIQEDYKKPILRDDGSTANTWGLYPAPASPRLPLAIHPAVGNRRSTTRSCAARNSRLAGARRLGCFSDVGVWVSLRGRGACSAGRGGRSRGIFAGVRCLRIRIRRRGIAT